MPAAPVSAAVSGAEQGWDGAGVWSLGLDLTGGAQDREEHGFLALPGHIPPPFPFRS